MIARNVAAITQTLNLNTRNILTTLAVKRKNNMHGSLIQQRSDNNVDTRTTISRYERSKGADRQIMLEV